MPIQLTMNYETVEEMLHDLTALVRRTALVQAAPTADPVGAGVVEPPLANGPVEVSQPQKTVVEEPPSARPRRGRPPKEGIAPQAQAQEPKSVDANDCIEAVKTLVNRTGDILAPGHVLSTFGVKKTRELTDDNRAAFVAACAAYVAEGSQAAGSQVS